MTKLTTVAFDADDTLWECERFFRISQKTFADMLADYADPKHLDERLEAIQRQSLGNYGYGIKNFVLSMIETAIEVTDGRVPAKRIKEILDVGHEMSKHPIDLIPGAVETLDAVADRYRIVLLTKGDLFDQERKVAASGLADRFAAIEIVSDKTVDTYGRVFADHGDGPERGMMVGNSMRSDVRPALDAGSWGVFVPHELSWSHEHAEAPDAHPRFHEISALLELPTLLERIASD